MLVINVSMQEEAMCANMNEHLVLSVESDGHKGKSMMRAL